MWLQIVLCDLVTARKLLALTIQRAYHIGVDDPLNASTRYMDSGALSTLMDLSMVTSALPTFKESSRSRQSELEGHCKTRPAPVLDLCMGETFFFDFGLAAR